MRYRKSRTLAALAAAAILPWAAPSASAQQPASAPGQPAAQIDPRTPELPPSKSLQVPPRIGVFGELKVTLQQVVESVLANDRDLEVSRIAAEEAGYNVTGAKGFYDPVLGLNAYRVRSVTPVASLIGGAANGKLTQKQLYANPEISGNSPWLGGSYKLDFVSSRQQTDNTFLALNPQFPTSLTLNLTQPLVRGLLFDENRHRLQVSRKNLLLTGEQLRQRTIEVVAQAVEAYWELDFAYRNLQVQTEAVRLAEQQDESNRRQVQQGLLAPVDVIQTQTQISTFQQNIYTAQEALTRAENALKQLMSSNREGTLWGVALIPETPVDLNVQAPALTDAVKEALSHRPEMNQSRLGLQVNKLDARLSAEQAKPQVNAVASLGVQGLSGNPVPLAPNPIFDQLGFGSITLPAIFPGGYSQSLNNLVNGRFPTVQVGVQMQFPIRNRTAEAQLAVTKAEGRRLVAQQQQIEMAVEADVRNSLQSLQASRARLDAASAARHSAEDQYASELRQFQAGTSSVFLVLQRQTDLTAARSREIRAKADLGRAAADFDRATTQILEHYNINLATPKF